MESMLGCKTANARGWEKGVASWFGLRKPPGMKPISSIRQCWRTTWIVALILMAGRVPAAVVPGDDLAYLQETDPFYVHRDFPRLTTPQWIGEDGVEAVVTLGIDDMRAVKKYEDFLRPILKRLKAIDGRAPVSIMTVNINPETTQLRPWLEEGVNLDVHTLTHPCPLLQKGNFEKAANVVHGGTDLLSQIGGNRPVAYRMPCCDSMNSTSPRFFAEIFNRVSQAGRFLSIDTSVFNITTSADRSLPREWVLDGQGRERFRQYLPRQTNEFVRVSMGSFATTIEDYPYPFVINRLCWEFPPMVPSDWEAHNLRGDKTPAMLADFKTCLDIAVRKQGTYNLVFHPHGWSGSGQIVELIDYAVKRYGPKVKFLNFAEAADRLNRHLLKGQSLRAANGQDAGVRLLDLNRDGFLDVVIGNSKLQITRLWQPENRSWKETAFPTPIVSVDAQGDHHDAGVMFGRVAADGPVIALVLRDDLTKAWRFVGGKWIGDTALLKGLTVNGQPVRTRSVGDFRDRGVRWRDVNGDGAGELIVGNGAQSGILAWSNRDKSWKPSGLAWPRELAIVNPSGQDNGLRFVDLNGDDRDDLVVSNEAVWGVYLYQAGGPRPGWSQRVSSGVRSDARAIPMIVRPGPYRNNGAWFHSGHLWVQNEDTARLPDKVDRRSFKALLRPVPNR
jgi:hypothetical protein